MRRLISSARAIFTAGVFAVLMALIALLALPRVSSFDLLIVSGGSMEPTIHVGSAVLVDRSARAPTVGTVMTFRDSTSRVVTHRVVQVGDGSFATKGDANASADVTRRSESDVIGTVRFSIPFLGYALYMFQQPILFYGLLIATLGALVLGQVRDIRDEVRRIRGKRTASRRADGSEPSANA